MLPLQATVINCSEGNLGKGCEKCIAVLLPTICIEWNLKSSLEMWTPPGLGSEPPSRWRELFTWVSWALWPVSFPSTFLVIFCLICKVLYDLSWCHWNLLICFFLFFNSFSLFTSFMVWCEQKSPHPAVKIFSHSSWILSSAGRCPSVLESQRGYRHGNLHNPVKGTSDNGQFQPRQTSSSVF